MFVCKRDCLVMYPYGYVFYCVAVCLFVDLFVWVFVYLFFYLFACFLIRTCVCVDVLFVTSQ